MVIIVTFNNATPPGYPAIPGAPEVTDTDSAWNPSDKTADVTLSNTNHTATVVSAGGTNGVLRGTRWRSANDNRFFYVDVTGPDGRNMAALATFGATIDPYPGVSGAGAYGYYGQNGNKYFNGASASYGSTFIGAARVGVWLNAGSITFYLWDGSDWVSQGVAYTGVTGTYFPTWGPGTVAAGTRSATIVTHGIGTMPPGAREWGGA
jgi:hypothetical protein